MELELVELQVSNLGLLELGQFIKDQFEPIGDLPDDFITDPTLIAGIKQVNDETAAFDKGMVKVTKNEFTEEVANSDDKRDGSIFAFGTAIHLGTQSDVEEEIKAAKRLETLFVSYGGIRIAKYNYEKESNAIDNMVNDCEGPVYSDDVALIGLGRYVNRLKRDNNSFKDIFGIRLKGEVGKEYFDSQLARKKLTERYNDFVGYVLYNARLRGTEEFIKVLTIINTTRKYFANLLAVRQGRKDANKKKGEEGNEPNPDPTE